MCMKEQFFNSLNDDDMIEEITCELTSFNDISSVTSRQVLAWVRRVEAQRGQNVILNSLKKNTEFDTVKPHKKVT